MAEEQKTDGEKFAEFVKEREELDRVLAESYAEAGMLPPGVVSRNPDTTTPEANYASRDNIVVSGASPYNVQSAVSGLSSDDQRRDDLDAADVAQRVSREDYEAAVKSAAPDGDPDLHPGVVDDGEDVTDEDEPRASGGSQPDEETVERVLDQLTEPEGEPTDKTGGLDEARTNESGDGDQIQPTQDHA